MLALVTAEAISSLGSLMTIVALPWFVLTTSGSPEQMGLVLAAEAAPLALLGIPTGRLAGRLGARRTLLVCDALWVPVVAAIPLLHYAGALSFSLLLGLAFLSGVPWAARYGSQNALLPEIVGEDTARLSQANAVFQTLSRLMYFVGPAAGGLLLSAFGAPTVLLIDAATFALSFGVIALFVEPAAVPRAPRSDEAAGGLRFIGSDPVLRPLTVAQVLSQAAFMAMTAAIPVLAFTAYERNAGLAGLMLGAWGAGAMVGAVLAFRLVESFAALRLGALAWCLQAVPLWLLAATPEPAIAVGALALSGLGNGVRVPPIVGVTTSRIPQELRAETMTVSSAIVLTGGFLALLAAGPALDAFGPAAVFAGVATLQTLAAVWALFTAYMGVKGAHTRSGARHTRSGALTV
jgi:predicted MFS family arabinose efflux permease